MTGGTGNGFDISKYEFSLQYVIAKKSRMPTKIAVLENCTIFVYLDEVTKNHLVHYFHLFGLRRLNKKTEEIN